MIIYFINVGSSAWKLHKCCKKYDVSKRCRPALCFGECKDKPWEMNGTSTGDEECDKYVDDVSNCCGPNWKYNGVDWLITFD